jgi:hypothetical protein
MQISGPWPPYHFVHRLTRTVHAHAAEKPEAGVAAVIPILEPAAVLA